VTFFSLVFRLVYCIRNLPTAFYAALECLQAIRVYRASDSLPRHISAHTPVAQATAPHYLFDLRKEAFFEQLGTMSTPPNPDSVEPVVPENTEVSKEKSTVRFDEKAVDTEIVVELQDGGRRNRPLEYVRSFRDAFSMHNVREAAAVLVKFGKFVGPGTIITVAYIDPDNFQTAVSSGAQFQYKLLFMVLVSNLIAIYLQVCQTMLSR
jgi:hypothetical protein